MSALRDKLARISVFIFAVALVAVGATVAGATPRVLASATEKPKWLVIPAFSPGEAGVALLGPTSGRGWIGFERGDGDSRSTLLGSLHRVGGKLFFAKAVLPRSQHPMMILGSNLVYHLPDPSGEPGELRTAPLLANGGVGVPKVIAGDPESIPPQQYDPLVGDGIQVGDRMVWALTGSKPRLSPVTDFLWACCTSAGELSDLSRFIDHQRDMNLLQLGRDAKGRLWLAWLDVRLRKAWGAVRMVELDPDTLTPRTPKTFVAPAPDSWMQPRLVCADRCRVVIKDLGGEIFTWTPGERSVTRMGLGTRQNPADLLDASFRSGSLLVASGTSSKGYEKGVGWNPYEIRLVRGAARGSRARSAGSVKIPMSFGDYTMNTLPQATFVPGGLVYFQTYGAQGSFTKTRFLAGFLPLTR